MLEGFRILFQVTPKPLTVDPSPVQRSSSQVPGRSDDFYESHSAPRREPEVPEGRERIETGADQIQACYEPEP